MASTSTSAPAEQQPATAPNVEGQPHEMRIASQGKLRSYVTFALKYLQEPHDRPLVLHTMPYKAPPQDLSKTTPSDAQPADPPLANDANPADPPPAAEPQPPAKPPPPPAQRKGLPASTSSIPRLVSVAEIIKREFLELNDDMRLHQYNFLGCLEDLEGGVDGDGEMQVDGEEEGRGLVDILDGKNHLQIRRTPYMKITLTKRQMEDHDPSKSTYQEPLPAKKRTKSSKARARKKRKKAEAEAQAAAAAQTDAEDQSEGAES